MNGSVAGNIWCEIDLPGQSRVTNRSSGSYAVVDCSVTPNY